MYVHTFYCASLYVCVYVLCMYVDTYMYTSTYVICSFMYPRMMWMCTPYIHTFIHIYIQIYMHTCNMRHHLQKKKKDSHTCCNNHCAVHAWWLCCFHQNMVCNQSACTYGHVDHALSSLTVNLQGADEFIRGPATRPLRYAYISNAPAYGLIAAVLRPMAALSGPFTVFWQLSSGQKGGAAAAIARHATRSRRGMGLVFAILAYYFCTRLETHTGPCLPCYGDLRKNGGLLFQERKITEWIRATMHKWSFSCQSWWG